MQNGGPNSPSYSNNQKATRVQKYLSRDALDEAVEFLQGHAIHNTFESSEDTISSWTAIESYLYERFVNHQLYIQCEDASMEEGVLDFHLRKSVPLDVEYLCNLVRLSNGIISTNDIRLFHPLICETKSFESVMHFELDLLSDRIRDKRTALYHNEENAKDIETFISTCDRPKTASGACTQRNNTLSTPGFRFAECQNSDWLHYCGFLDEAPSQ